MIEIDLNRRVGRRALLKASLAFPITTSLVPVERMFTQTQDGQSVQAYMDNHPFARTLIGALLGGSLGFAASGALEPAIQQPSGSGKIAHTLAGAVMGAVSLNFFLKSK